MNKKDKILKLFMIMLFIYLPIFDMLRMTSFKNFEILGLSFIELINIVLIGTSFVIALLKCNKKKWFLLGGYFLILGIYLYLHYINAVKIDPNIFKFENLSFIREAIYIFRLYILPLFVIFILTTNRDVFDKKFYILVVKILIGIISFSIIILDILKLSYPSYEDIVDFKYVPYSILDFYKYNGDAKDLLAKGWFESANEMSVVLFALLPVNILFLFKENKKSNVILFLAQLLAMIIMGTRTSAYGSILVTGACIFMYLFFVIIKQNKFNQSFFVKFVITFGISILLFIILPFRQYKREIEPGRLEISNEEKLELILKENKTDEELIKALSNNLYEFGINPEIEALYPIGQDLDFWLNIYKRDLIVNNDSRTLKNDVAKRIHDRNNNFSDNIVGMHFFLYYMDIERDYLYQYYLLGIVGIILSIGVYFASYISSIIIFFKNFNKRFKFEYVLLFMAVFLELSIAYLSGHTYGAPVPMFTLSLLVSMVRFYVVGDENDKG